MSAAPRRREGDYGCRGFHILVGMELDSQITATEYSAFVKCPTKAYLLATGEPAPQSYFAALETRVSSSYKIIAKRQRLVCAPEGEFCNFEQFRCNQEGKVLARHVDCETAVFDLGRTGSACDRSRSKSGMTAPVLFVPWEKPDVSDNLLACFGALVLCQVAGTLPSTAAMIYGCTYRRKTVNIEEHVARTQQFIDAMKAVWREQRPPTPVLNKHCSVCDFQARCRGIAIERDDLSLIAAMTVKERAKCTAKGIFTIAQLSYGYRPRRRKRSRPNSDQSKFPAKRHPPLGRNDHNLKALAIKKNQIHVVGAPSLRLEGDPVFLDVEGMLDREFYYLIGLRFECRGVSVERSFWAERTDAERQMWENCLLALKAIENPQIVSYGAYEARFLRRMKERYVREPYDVEFVDRLIKSHVNLVGCIYGKVYFPTFSNSLKEVARYLGFDWTWAQASGAATPLLRRAWELSADDEIKRELLGYNIADCRAAATVANALDRISGGGDSGLDAVDISSLEVSFQHAFGKLDCALPEFKRINDAAYWDYQRSKVYARTDKAVRQSVLRIRRQKQRTIVEKELSVESVPASCPRCQATRVWIHCNYSQVVFDLKFTRRGSNVGPYDTDTRHIDAVNAARRSPPIIVKPSSARTCLALSSIFCSNCVSHTRRLPSTRRLCLICR